MIAPPTIRSRMTTARKKRKAAEALRELTWTSDHPLFWDGRVRGFRDALDIMEQAKTPEDAITALVAMRAEAETAMLEAKYTHNDLKAYHYCHGKETALVTVLFRGA